MRGQSGAFRLAVSAAALLLAACVSDQPRETWTDPSWHGPPLKKVVVVADQRSDGRRRLWEDGMALAFKAKGFEAVPSYQLVPHSQPTVAEISEVAARAGYDGMVASHLIGMSTNVQQGQGEHRLVPELVTGADGRVYTVMRSEYQPGDLSSETVADYQTDVYATDQGGKLIWTAASHVRDLSSVKAIAQRVSTTIIPSLQAAGALGGGNGKP